MRVAVTFPIPEAAKDLLSDMFDCRFWESDESRFPLRHSRNG